MKRLFTLIIAAAFIASYGCGGNDDDKNPEDVPGEETEDIAVVDGKVRFYLQTDDTAPSLSMGGAAHRWSTQDKVRVNNNQYSVKVGEDKRYYIEVNAAEDNVYKAGFYKSNKYFETSCFSGVFFPYAQYYDSEGYAPDFPKYAVYSKSTGNKLIFKDGYGVLALTLKGSESISSIKVEDASGAYLGGGLYNFDETKGSLVASGQTGAGFIALNCAAGGEGVALTSSGETFYVAVPARNYASGLRLTICDRGHRAMFHDVSAVNIEPNKTCDISLSYAPASDLCFYEGFDTFVWGGNIMAGEGSAAYAPDDSAIGIEDRADFTGYEEPLTAVACDNPGTGYMQPNTWDASKNVAANPQMSESYLRSRNLWDWNYLFRCQEYQGCVAIGTASTARGIMQTCQFSHIGSLAKVEISFKFCFQAGVTDDLLCHVNNGGRITACKLNGAEVELTADNSSYEANSSALKIFRSQVDIPSGTTKQKSWNTVTLTVENANDGTSLYLTSVTSTSGTHGIYADEITVKKISAETPGGNNLRVLLWNIQNGMWSDQGNNYDNFVKWVKKYDPDVCVWCEAQTIYKTGTSTAIASSERYLTDNWGALAARYGHSYWTKGGHRDNYPQVITSKYPITKITDITNGPNVTVSHGACQAKVTVNGKEIHIVTLHLWPQSYAFGVTGTDNQTASTAEKGGDKYREKEIKDILAMTINKADQSGVTNWLMMGDFNSRSILDNWFYKYDESDTRFLVHNYIQASTTMKDVIAERYPGLFFSSTSGNSRIDFMYASPAMFDRISNSISVVDSYATLKADASVSFYHPSDHRPVMADFDMK